MTRDPRYDILFQPVKIGPVTARNRFFQVPHCNGMGYRHPQAHAAMRAMKAEGGWGVVANEECDFHPTSDVAPFIEGRLWDDHDIPHNAMLCDAVHEHGALAACELTHNGLASSNLYSRETLLAPSDQMSRYFPWQARAMDRQDIREFRKWHRAAVARAKKAGFDIIYVYAGHDLTMALHFLQRRRNHRTDEYGGSLENRARLLREMIEDAKDVAGATCAIAVRFGVEEMQGEGGITSAGEGHDVVAMLAELPDLWDVNVSDWKNDSATSRFSEEGFQESHIAFVKKLTTKPVVGVGRFTSPDAMVSQIKRGILDFIGAARPSIADPFLPRKIEEGRIDDIRECIGCNICIIGDSLMVPIRCTQNPTMGEEWRKGWHPEIIAPRANEERVLVVGAGPAGLEAARALGQRGHEVHLAEAGLELGGRVTLESRLPGIAAWARVRDYRLGQIAKMPNVSIYRDSRLTGAHVLEFGMDHVVLATGADWRRDGGGRSHPFGIDGLQENPAVLSPDDVMAGKLPITGPAIVYDDEHFYLASLIAEALKRAGLDVIYVTSGEVAASWSANGIEATPINRQLRRLGIRVIVQHELVSFDGDKATIACIYSGERKEIGAVALVPVTSRRPRDELHQELTADMESAKAAGIKSVTRIGDCLAPGLIAQAVYSGHSYARELGSPPIEGVPFRRVLALQTT